MVKVKTASQVLELAENGRVKWLFTSGLSISAIIDVAIAGVLIYYLKQSRTGWSAYVSLATCYIHGTH